MTLSDRAMLCALQPENREIYIENMIANLKPGGLFLGILFSEIEAGIEGPPFALNREEITRLFLNNFSLVSWESHLKHDKPSFINSEYLCIWRRL